MTTPPTNFKIEIPEIALSKPQEDLLKELKNISDLCSKLYLDIVKLINIDFLDTKSHLIGHLMRELDSGIRESLAYKTDPQLPTEQQIDEIYKIMKTEFKQKGFKNTPKRPKEYISSICKILDTSSEFKLITEWTLSGSQLHHFAHRGQFSTDVRPFRLIEDIWERYQNVLFQIVGSPFALIGVFDNYLAQSVPKKEQIAILGNLLKKPNYQSYFYSNLEQINWLKPLNEADFFNPKNNPKPEPSEDENGFYILSWSIFNYLEWVSKNLPTDDETVVKELVKIIDNIVSYKENGNRIQNFRTDFSIFKILNNIPSDYITETHLSFINHSLETDFHSGLIGSELSKGFITKLISDDKKELLVKLIDIVCSYKKINEDIQPLIEEYWFAKLVNDHKTELSRYTGKEIIEVLLTKIREIKGEDSQSFNVVWIPTIESHEQKSFPQRYEAQLVDLLVECLILMDLENQAFTKKIEELLKDDLDILKRIGIYLINQKFELLNKLLFDLDYNPLEDYNLKHEIYELLKSNSTKLSEDQIKIIIKWIEEKQYYLENVKPEDKDKILAYRKKEWYIPLLASGNQAIKELYNKYNKINEREPDHPGFVSWHTAWAGEATPLQEFELEKATIDKIISEIKNFKEEKGIKKPTVRGFADTIQRDVEKNPLKYCKELEKFNEIDLPYLCAIIRGFINISRKNRDTEENIVKLNWREILNFIDEQINEEFWSLPQTQEFDYRNWFVDETANLIEDGTKDDKTSFDIQLLPKAKKILLKLTKHNVFYSINTEDYVTFALNTTEGKILDAMLNYSLRNYRVVKKEWDKDIKDYFNKKISEKRYVEVFIILGQYLPQFYTLDKEWTGSNFDLIFPLDNKDILKASISGLFFNSIVYSNFYSLFKEKGIYKFLLDSWEENSDGTNESLLRHICLGYAEKWEEIQDNSLIKDLLDKNGALEEIVRFFWIISNNIKQEYLARVKGLWEYIYEKNKNSNITGKLMQWLRIFNKLDDDLFKFCIGGAKFVNIHDVHYIVEYLTKYLDSDIEKTGKILLEIVDNVKILSDYRKEDVIRIVEKLYSENKKQLANDICNKYFEKQNLLFLREIYNKNNIEVKNE